MNEQLEHKPETLMNWNKRRLVDYVVCLEHNNNVLRDQLDSQYKAFKKFLDQET